MTSNLRGVLVALATPFTADDNIDIDALRALVDRTIDGGVHGVVACGSTGECSSLTANERRLVVETVVHQTAGRVPVVAQTGSTSTSEAIVLARHAQAVGADVIMPDVPKCGGLAESRKIANLAEMYYVPFAPHLVSTPLGTMATCHVCASVPNFLVLEWHALEEREAWDGYVRLPDGAKSIVEDGHIVIPDTPGIGVELNMDGVHKYAVPGFGIFE